MVEYDIKKLKVVKSKQNNIWTTIKKIEKNKGVIKHPADKGGGLVILNNKDYEMEIKNLLRVEGTYKKLKINTKKGYKKDLKVFLTGKDRGILNKKEVRYLIPEAAKTSVIYYDPKIHKNQEKPPGRHIISEIESLFSRLGEYLDHFLQPLVPEGRSYLKDS